MNPKISVVMTAYNAADYISETIQSVLNQTFPYFELIIVDDGSTDKTLEIISEFKDDRIHVVKRLNGGPATAANSGLKVANCQYVARIDSDDVCYPNRLELQYDFMENHSDYVMVGGGVMFIEEDGTEICEAPIILKPSEIHQKLDFYSPIAHSTVFMKREIALKCGGYDERLWGFFDDQLLWSKMRHMGKIGNLADLMVKYRFRPSASTTKNNSKEFLKLKRNVIQQGFISQEQVIEYAKIRKNESSKQKEYSYYILLAKKYCFNNFQFKSLLINVLKAIYIRPYKVEPYILLAISVLPYNVIQYFYKRKSE